MTALRFEELNAKPGDVVVVMADCTMEGVRVVVPEANHGNCISNYGSVVWVINDEHGLKAYHTGECWGDPNKWGIERA